MLFPLKWGFYICTGEKYEEKVHKIKKLLAGDDIDIKKLQEFAISPGGFVTNEIRQEAWPKLVGIDVENIPPKPG